MGLIQTICFRELLRIAASSYQKEEKNENKNKTKSEVITGGLKLY